MPLTTPPPILQAAPAAPLNAPQPGEAERSLLSDLDSGNALVRPAKLAAPDRQAFEWLWSAAHWSAGDKAPANPFTRGAGAQEAQAWRAFLEGGKGSPAKLPLSLDGSRLLLWTWMRDRDRGAPLGKRERQRLEDRLLADGDLTIRGWALRHALCFAVAEGDTARFSALKAKHGAQAPDTFAAIQSLFGLLGGPSPVFRLWQLPGLHYQDATLGELHARKVWICPPGPAVPEDAAWIIPSSTGQQGDREAVLSPALKAEAETTTASLGPRAAWFAAAKGDWESVGLQWFPALIELDGNGNVERVRMGDAAP